MARIRSSDTKIELLVRRALHALGFRYRLGGVGLPGRPDLVLPRYKVVIFVHGCFWHGHDCPLYRLPKPVRSLRIKVESNRQRDLRVTDELMRLGWRVHTLWECSLRRATAAELDVIFADLANRIRSQRSK